MQLFKNISDFLNNKFRYTLKELMAFENDPQIREQRVKTIKILMTGFIIYTLSTLISCIEREYYHGIVTNISLTLIFFGAIVWVQHFRQHTTPTIVCSYLICVILFFHFIMETDWTLGMDAFWLFILVLPFIVDYLAGVVYGTMASGSGLILSLLLFRTPMSGYLQPYGSNMQDWFSIIYIVVTLAAIVIVYELTAYQIDKKKSDEQIAYYEQERNQRLKEQLTIYENNEQTIRKYKHDIRHYNRILAGFIQDGEYEKAGSYLKEFDTMLEEVTAVSFCDNKVINELLTIYVSRCQKMGFKLRARVNVPEVFPIEEVDLTSLVANAIENAYEAQTRVPQEKRFIQAEIIYDGRKLKMLVKNAAAGNNEFTQEGLPVSTKPVKSGIGTEQIKCIAEKYGGAASFSLENGVFTVRAVLTCL